MTAMKRYAALMNGASGPGCTIAAPIYQQPVFQKMAGYQNVSLPETDRAVKQVFSLPVHPGLTDEEVDYIVKEVNILC